MGNHVQVLAGVLVATMLAGCAAPAAPRPAPILAAAAPVLTATGLRSVYGLAIGEPLALPECPKWVPLREMEYKPADSLCVRGWKAMPAPLDLRETSNVTIMFPAGRSLVMSSHNRVGGFIMNGTLQAVTIHTAGYDVQQLVFDELVQKYGQPTRATRAPLQSGLGAIAGGILAEWVLPDLEVSFVGVAGSVRTGVVNIGTPQGLREASARRQRAMESINRPL